MKKIIAACTLLLINVVAFTQATDPYLVFPIELKFFQASNTGQQNTLRWLAPCITNEATFEVQHSTDNKNFSVLTTITADQARCREPFDYTDAVRRSGNNYYRIRLITPSNTSVHSFIVVVLNKASGFELNALLPSLVTTTATLSISSATKDRLAITVTDINGRQFLVQQQELLPGTNQVQLNLQGLPAGQYFIKAINSKEEQIQLRFLKQ